MILTGSTILITGGDRALAEALHNRGNSVIITGRDTALLEAINAERPGITGLPLDLGDHSALAGLADPVKAGFPSLNVLIANAGISRTGGLVSGGRESHDAEAIIDTNIMDVLRTASTFVPLPTKQRIATLMATSSVPCFLPLANFPPTAPARRSCIRGWYPCVTSFAICPWKYPSFAPPVRPDLTNWPSVGQRPMRHARRGIRGADIAQASARRSSARGGSARPRPGTGLGRTGWDSRCTIRADEPRKPVQRSACQAARVSPAASRVGRLGRRLCARPASGGRGWAATIFRTYQLVD